MLNRTVHHTPSAVQVPVPYRLAKKLADKGYDINVLVREMLQKRLADENELRIEANRGPYGNEP